MPTVLVVDDDPVVRAVVRVMATRENFAVREAEDLAQAKEVLAEDPDFDVIICDYLLPDGVGLDLLETAPELADRFVLLTGTSERDEFDDGRVDLVSAYLTKPVGSDALAATLNQMVGAHSGS